MRIIKINCIEVFEIFFIGMLMGFLLRLLIGG